MPPQTTSRLLLAALFGTGDTLWQENQKCLINKPPVSWCDSVFTTVGSFVICQRERWADREENAEGIDVSKHHRHLLFIHSATCWYFIRCKFNINYDSDRARMASYKVETILQHGSCNNTIIIISEISWIRREPKTIRGSAAVSCYCRKIQQH